MRDLKDTTLIYDDATGYELEEFVRQVKPDLVGSGIKEKYTFHKMGVPFRQMHSWDYSGPYHGYDGFAVFARDMDMAVNNPCWTLFKAPWQKSTQAIVGRLQDSLRRPPPWLAKIMGVPAQSLSLFSLTDDA